MSEPRYHVADVIETLGCTRTFFNSWMQRGLLKPSVPAKGSGRPSLWTADDILTAKLTKLMGDAGLNLQVAHKWAEMAIRLLGQDQLIVDLETGKQYFNIADCPADVFLTINIDAIRERVIASLE